MRVTAKFLLWTEVTVCFAPAVVLLALGLIMVPVQIFFLITRPGEEGSFGALTVIAMTGGGVAGLVALANLLSWIMRPPAAFIDRYWTLAGAVAGAAALLPYTAGELDSAGWRLVGWMPLVCSVHLMYLARAFLFGAEGDDSHA